jgi:hypothetical protein
MLGLGHLLLYDVPPLLALAGFGSTIVGIILGWLGLREGQAVLQQLSHRLGRRPTITGIGSAALLLCGLLGWIFLGVPKVEEVAGGPLGIKQPGIHRVLVADFKLLPAAAVFDLARIGDVRQVLLQKLSLAESVEIVCTECPQTTTDILKTLDLTVQGKLERSAQVRLLADLYGRRGAYLSSIAQDAWTTHRRQSVRQRLSSQSPFSNGSALR